MTYSANQRTGPFFRSAGGRRGCSGAFSLLEMIIVLSVLAILASIAVPKFAGATARYRLDSAARRVAADIEQARVLARATGTTQSIMFNPGTDSYTIVNLVNADDKGAGTTVYLANPPYSIALDAVSFAGLTQLQFGGFGVPAVGGTVRLRSGTSTTTVSVDASTGMTTIQ